MRFIGLSIPMGMVCLLWVWLYNIGEVPSEPRSESHSVLRNYLVKPTTLQVNPLKTFRLSDQSQRILVQESYRRHKWNLAGSLHALRLGRHVERICPDLAADFWRLLIVFTTQSEMDRRFKLGASILIDTVDGVGYRTGQGTLDELMPHVDNLLAEFGELGIGLGQPIKTRWSNKTLGDSLNNSMRRANFDRELEWSILAYCSYLGHQSSWHDRNMNPISVSDLCRRLLEKHRGRGPCFGTHREYALARVASTSRTIPGFISQDIQAAVEKELVAVSELLTERQKVVGSWNTIWANGDAISRQSENEITSTLERLCVTGHILEWMSVCPVDLRPAEEVIAREARWCMYALMTNRELFDLDYSSATHAVRALLQLVARQFNAIERVRCNDEKLLPISADE